MHSIAAVTSMAMVAFQFSSVCSQTHRSVPGAAALLHMMSTWPNTSTARETIAATSVSLVTSARMAIAPFPAAAAASRTSSSLRAANSTRAPSRAKVAAITGPSPVLAPVMIATFPSSRRMRAHISSVDPMSMSAPRLPLDHGPERTRKHRPHHTGPPTFLDERSQ